MATTAELHTWMALQSRWSMPAWLAPGALTAVGCCGMPHIGWA